MRKITILLTTLIFQLNFAQKTCLTALPITAGTYTITAINGTEVPLPVCLASGLGATNGEWYSYTPSQNYTLTITTNLQENLTSVDTRFHVFIGSCNDLTCFNGNDDVSATAPANYSSTSTFSVFAGITYTIAFDNRWTSAGFTFKLIETPFINPPINFTFSNIESSSEICCVADMDGDFKDDIVTVANNSLSILTQQSNNGFLKTTYPLPNLSTLPDWSITAGDFDKNGRNDLVLGGSSRLTIVKQNNLTYTEIPYPQNIFTQRANFIDINNDGNLDLFACHDEALSHVYRNDGAGNLIFDNVLFPTLAVGGNYQSMWTDYNNDGFQDMYMSKCRGNAAVGDPQRINLLYKNNGNGTFTEVGAAAGVNDGYQSWSTAIEDFDNDGDMDFLVSNISDQNKLYKNNGDGTFTDVFASSGIDAEIGSWEVQAADFNNDGLIDFLWQNEKELYLNNGNLTFTGYNFPFSEGGIGDLNNDGFLDVQYSNKIYLNKPNANNWLKVHLVGIQSNRNGIGARLEIYGAWGKQIREIRSGSGFSHQSSLNGFFGIGLETEITKLIIRWPSGTVDEILNPTKNQALLVTEGSSPVLSNNNFGAINFSVSPNPVSDVLNIQTNNLTNIQNIQIFDLSGRLIVSLLKYNNFINVQNLNFGIYFIILKDLEGNKYSQKFLKQ